MSTLKFSLKEVVIILVLSLSIGGFFLYANSKEKCPIGDVIAENKEGRSENVAIGGTQNIEEEKIVDAISRLNDRTTGQESGKEKILEAVQRLNSRIKN